MRPAPPRKSRYAKVAQDLAQEIENGSYKIGDLLPSEADLCKRYNISNHTVRHAMRVLHDMKLTTPERGRGTRVVAISSKKRYIHTLDSIPDLGELAKNTKIRVIRRTKIPFDHALTPLPAHVPEWQLIEAIRYVTAKEPLVWKHVYIDPIFTKAANKIGSSSEPIYKLIERFYDESLTKVMQEVGAVLIRGEAAGILRVTEGAPGLAIARKYIGASGRILEVTYSVYPADRFRYHSELRLEHTD
jgi:GntR family transcriptional regulator